MDEEVLSFVIVFGFLLVGVSCIVGFLITYFSGLILKAMSQWDKKTRRRAGYRFIRRAAIVIIVVLIIALIIGAFLDVDQSLMISAFLSVFFSAVAFVVSMIIGLFTSTFDDDDYKAFAEHLEKTAARLWRLE